ncbi:MAG: FimV/HubP family polar landmark protein, partial [Bordetella sp.]|nr:FimV/HubP family polar landmark protein [Bordetella sp.]
MSSSARQLHQVSRLRVLSWAVALAIGATAATQAQAARLGHARVLSAPGAPAQISVPLLELTPDEANNLQVSLAPQAAWDAAGLTPPVPLARTYLRVDAGRDTASRTIVINSDQPLSRTTVDLLLNLRSASGERQLQVTILVPARTTPEIQRASTGPAAAGTAAASASEVRVRKGDTLYGVAQRNAVPDATIYQMLVALWRANPQAFIDNNMNRVRAGQTLTVPDAATVRAIDPAEARRIYVEQVEAYARWRARLGGTAADAAVSGGAGAAGRVSSADTGGTAQAGADQD